MDSSSIVGKAFIIERSKNLHYVYEIRNVESRSDTMFLKFDKYTESGDLLDKGYYMLLNYFNTLEKNEMDINEWIIQKIK
tara:strand:- start:2678 stop:2917 length:240 start_codon:yes stop_codon:yes gene_type:complete